MYLLLRPSLLGPPTGCERRDESWTVYEMAGPVHPDGLNVAASPTSFVAVAAAAAPRPRRCGDGLSKLWPFAVCSFLFAFISPVVVATLQLGDQLRGMSS